MLGFESEAILAKILLEIEDLERRVEMSRQDLSQDLNFNPYAAFDQLDRLGVKKISIDDLRYFLSLYNIEGSCHLLPSQYDSGLDGYLSLPGLFSLILPSENISLREEAQGRKGSLSFLSQQKLARHLQLEISSLENLEIAKIKLNSRYDYSELQAFRSVSCRDFIDLFDLQIFLKRYGADCTPDMLIRILRRIDSDNDMKLSFKEFSDYFSRKNSFNVSRKHDVTPTLKRRSKSKRRIKSLYYQKDSPAKSKRKNSPIRYTTPLRNKSPDRSNDKKRSVTRKLFAKPIDNIDRVKDVLKAQIRLANILETARVSLSKDSEFNINSLIEMFDFNGHGCIGPGNLECFLRDMNIQHRVEDVYLLMRRYSSALDNRISICDFIKMWVPQTLKHRGERSNGQSDKMNAHTIDKIKITLSVFIDCERQAEALRKGHNINNLFEVFKYLDRNDDEVITFEDFKLVLEEFEDMEIERLMDWYKKTTCRKISYSEFSQELTS